MNKKTLKYEHNGHSIIISNEAPMLADRKNEVFVDGVLLTPDKDEPAKISKIGYNSVRIDFPDGEQLTWRMQNADSHRALTSAYHKGPDLPNEFSNQYLGYMNIAYEAHLTTKDGEEIFQIPDYKHERNPETVKSLAAAYEQIGSLTQEQFLGLKKALGENIQQIKAGTNFYLNMSGSDEKAIQEFLTQEPQRDDVILRRVSPDDISSKDKIVAVTTNGFSQVTGILAFEAKSVDLTRSQIARMAFHAFDNKLKDITIEGEGVAITNLNVDKAMDNFIKLQEKGLIDLENLQEILPPTATWDEFLTVQEIYERGLTITDQLLEDLSHGASIDEAMRASYDRFVEQELGIDKLELESSFDMEELSEPLIESMETDIKIESIEMTEQMETIMPIEKDESIEPTEPIIE